MPQTIIKITVVKGCVDVECVPGSGQLAELPPIVQVWDYDCEGDGGNHEDHDGTPFNLSVFGDEGRGFDLSNITMKDLECKPISHDEVDE